MSSAYAFLKALHVGCVAVSGALFALRGAWMLADPERLARRWVRVAPHVIDTVLLASAIALAVMTRDVPGNDGWLTAKVIGVLVYIVLGSIALKRGRTRGLRIAAFAGALATFAWIVSVAVTKSPAGFPGTS